MYLRDPSTQVLRNKVILLTVCSLCWTTIINLRISKGTTTLWFYMFSCFVPFGFTDLRIFMVLYF